MKAYSEIFRLRLFTFLLVREIRIFSERSRIACDATPGMAWPSERAVVPLFGPSIPRFSLETLTNT
jgi:hypothetical protein